MKFIKLKVKVRNISNIDYESLGVETPQEDLSVEEINYSLNWLKQEIMHIHEKEDVSVITLYDNTCIHVYEDVTTIIKKLNDSE